MTAPIIPGAEPDSIAGGPDGALVLHGFTGNPVSMRGIADALAGAGFAVELPLLPGHGTSVDDMLVTTWADWSGAAEQALADLQARTPDGKVVVVGLSMGGALACWLAANHPEIAGIVAINAVVSAPPGLGDLLAGMVEAGETTMDAIGADIADPEGDENAYPVTPLKPLLSLLEAADGFTELLGRIACPTLIITSRQDHTVEPSNSVLLGESVTGPVEHVWLEKSFHVATVDYDKAEIEERTVAFTQRVTG